MSQAADSHTTHLNLVTARPSGVGFIEPAMVTDIFCTELAAVDELGGGVVRLTFTVKQRGCDNSVDDLVIAKLVVPAVCLVTWAVQLSQSSGRVAEPRLPIAANANQTSH